MNNGIVSDTTDSFFREVEILTQNGLSDVAKENADIVRAAHFESTVKSGGGPSAPGDAPAIDTRTLYGAIDGGVVDATHSVTGVKPDTYPDGDDVLEVALKLEDGDRTVQARPMWRKSLLDNENDLAEAFFRGAVR